MKKSVNKAVHYYTRELEKGMVPFAYREILSFMTGLAGSLSKEYPEYRTGALYPGSMDMTFFTFTPPELTRKKLKIIVVYLHKKGAFGVWLGAENRTVRGRYIDFLGSRNPGILQMSLKVPETDSIAEAILEERPDFDHPEELAGQLRQGILEFIQEVLFLTGSSDDPVREKLASSLTAETTELLPFLPYLLQDLWDMGSSPRDMEELIRRHIPDPRGLRVLDLACGKGAVSIHLAQVLGCRILGIDLMPDFIRTARQKARQYGVEELCRFQVEDIGRAVHRESGYDLTILGAAGDVLGGPLETLKMLKETIRPWGYILLDDAYAGESAGPGYHTREQWMDAIRSAGLFLMGELIMDPEELNALNDRQQEKIAGRALELKKAHPELVDLFDGYLRSQQAECEDLEQRITGVTMLLSDREQK